MEPEISEDEAEYRRGLTRLTKFSEDRLQEWKTANKDISDAEKKLEKLNQRMTDEQAALEKFRNKRASYFINSKESAELDTMIQESETRINKIEAAIEMVEKSILPARKIEMISARRRFRTSQQSIEILERNHLKKIVGKAKRHQHRPINAHRPIRPRNNISQRFSFQPPMFGGAFGAATQGDFAQVD